MNFACEKKSWARLRKNHILESDLGCCNNERSQHAVASRAGTTGLPCSMVEMLIKWLSLSRLETRTKESNVYASIRVANPECAMKVIGENPDLVEGGIIGRP